MHKINGGKNTRTVEMGNGQWAMGSCALIIIIIIFYQNVAFKIINFGRLNVCRRSNFQTSAFQTFLLPLSLSLHFFLQFFFLSLIHSPLSLSLHFFRFSFLFFLSHGETRVRGLRRKKKETSEERSPYRAAASPPANLILACGGEASASGGEASGGGR